MNNSNQHITIEILLKSLENDFDKVDRARIFQSLKDTEPTDDALIGAKMLLEENNWDYTILQQAFDTTQDKIDAVALGTKQTHKRQPYLKSVAVLTPAAQSVLLKLHKRRLFKVLILSEIISVNIEILL